MLKVEAISLVAAPERLLGAAERDWGGDDVDGGSAQHDARDTKEGGGLAVEDVTKYGKAVEQVVRCVSNLLERFHQVRVLTYADAS